MIRDMDLVRKILMVMNEHEGGYAPSSIEIEGYTSDQVGHHCYLLMQAGLIEGADSTSMNDPSPTAIPLNLTWNGHEFIVTAKDENIWQQTKQAVSKMGDASFSVWTAVLSQESMLLRVDEFADD